MGPHLSLTPCSLTIGLVTWRTGCCVFIVRSSGQTGFNNAQRFLANRKHKQFPDELDWEVASSPDRGYHTSHSPSLSTWFCQVNLDPISLLLLAADRAPGTERPACSQKVLGPRGENLPCLSHVTHVARCGLEILAGVLFFSITSFPDEIGKPSGLRNSLRAQ